MGCAAAKDAVAEDARGADNHRNGQQGDGGRWLAEQLPPLNPHEVAVAQHLRDLENKRPQTLESYWVAGSIDSTNAPPHYVPLRGPMGVVQRLPPHAANIRKRVLTCLVTLPLASVSPPQQMPMPQQQQAPTSPLLATASSPLLATTSDVAQGDLDASHAGTGALLGSPPRGGPSDGPLDDEYSVPPALVVAPPPLPPPSAGNNMDEQQHLQPAHVAPPGGGGAITPQRQATKGTAMPLLGLSSARRLPQRPISVGGGSGGGGLLEDPLTALVLAFPMPRWFAVEQQLPSSERVLLEAAEGKLSIHGESRSSCMSYGNGTIGNGKAASSTALIHRPPLAPSPMLEVALLDATGGGQQHSVYGSTTAMTAVGCQMRAHYVVPEDAIVARAFLPHALCNYTVGWIKVPVAPVSFKQSSSTDAAQRKHNAQPLVEVVVIRNGIDGLVNNDAPNTNGSGDGATTTTLLQDGPASVGRVGFLSPDKPVYNTAVDGPVSQPFDACPGTDAHRQHNPLSERSLLPRYLEKYFLYVKQVTAVCITLSWRNATDVDASFADVSLNHQIAMPHNAVTQPPLRPDAFSTDGGSGVGCGGETLENPRSTQPQRRSAPNGGGLQQQQQHRANASPYFMALPVAATSASPSRIDPQASGSNLGATTDAIGVASVAAHGSVGGCLPSLHAAMLMGETSLPLYVHTPIRLLFPALAPHLAAYAAATVRGRVPPTASKTPSATASPLQEDAAAAAPAHLHESSITALVKKLRHDDLCWLAFRLRFLEWMLSAVQTCIRAQQQCARSEPLPPTSSQLQAVHLALRLGLRFQYDNTQFVAFNEYGRHNYKSKAATSTSTVVANDGVTSPVSPGSGTPGGSGGGAVGGLLEFVDKTRTPQVETSAIVAESPTVVFSCRLAHTAPAAVPSPPAGGSGPSPDTTTFYSEAETEVTQLRCLFEHFLPDVHLH